MKNALPQQEAAPGRRREWSTEEAFRYCQRLARRHYENFPVASLLLPAEHRPHVAAIYAFARRADDLADEPGLTPAERVEQLRRWRTLLFDASRGEATHPVFVALRETLRRYELPVELLDRLLEAFLADVTVRRYQTFADLLGYCRNSANPIGRIVLHLFGYRSEHLFSCSDSICTALQLANFWQDLSVDLQKDRVYLPIEDLRQFSYTEEELLRAIFNDSFRRLMSFEVERTERLFEEGKPLLREVGRDLRRELRLTWEGGMAILRKIRRRDYRVLERRPALSVADKIQLLVSSLRRD
jgi:squalene synthase HpnC